MSHAAAAGSRARGGRGEARGGRARRGRGGERRARGVDPAEQRARLARRGGRRGRAAAEPCGDVLVEAVPGQRRALPCGDPHGDRRAPAPRAKAARTTTKRALDHVGTATSRAPALTEAAASR